MECGVLELQWQAAQWNRVTRKLVSQVHGYFMSLQKQSREGEGVSDDLLVEYSQFYRSSLHECVLGLQMKTEGKFCCQEQHGESSAPSPSPRPHALR